MAAKTVIPYLWLVSPKYKEISTCEPSLLVAYVL